MRVQSIRGCVLAGLMTMAAAAPALAQAPGAGSSSIFNTVRFTAGDTNAPARPAVGVETLAPRRQADDQPISGLVFGGFNSGYGGVGFAVGGGVQVDNVADREEFGLQFDALYSNVGECFGCPDDFGSASQIAVAGAFLYKFRETTTGWRPFAGGGIVFTRFSFSFDDDFVVCQIVNVDCDEAVTEVGIQAQGGIARGNLHFEGRVQGTAGGGFLGLVGYRFR